MRKKPLGFHTKIVRSFQNYLYSSRLKKFIDFLNPTNHFGEKEDKSLLVAQGITVFVLICAEIFLYIPGVPSQMTSSTLAVLTLLATVIYSSLRNGRLYGIISAFLCGVYALYAFSRLSPLFHYTNAREKNAVIILIFLLLIAFIVGWLRETIDRLFLSERRARNQIEIERAHLEAMLRQLPTGVLYIKSPNGKIILANREMEEIFQTPFPAVKTLQDFKTIMIQRKNGKIVNFPRFSAIQALKKGKVILDEEFQIIRNNTSVAYIRMNATPILNKNNRVTSAVAVFDNITALKEIERLKDEFISIMSHELKAPMTSLKGYAGIIKRQTKKYQDDRLRYYIQKIEDQTSNMSGLINDILDLSRIQTGKMSIHKENFDIRQLIQDTIEAFSQTTRIHTIHFENTQTITVHADRFRIYQVLSNLISNAIKYSPNGGKILVNLTKNRNSIVVSVTDQGIGLTDDQAKRVFDKLYQAATPKGRRFPGLGMGLYISKEIVSMHKGKIWVVSERNKGSTFYFSLPLDKREVALQKKEKSVL